MKTEEQAREMIALCVALDKMEMARGISWMLGEWPPAEAQKTERELQLEDTIESLKIMLEGASETIKSQYAALREKGNALGLAQQELEQLKAGSR